jgi:hypothetical protein
MGSILIRDILVPQIHQAFLLETRIRATSTQLSWPCSRTNCQVRAFLSLRRPCTGILKAYLINKTVDILNYTVFMAYDPHGQWDFACNGCRQYYFQLAVLYKRVSQA